MIGDWVLTMVLASSANVPVLGEFRTLTRSTLAVRIEDGPEGLVQTQRLCSSTINDGKGMVRTLLPPSFIAAVPVARFPITVAEVDGVRTYAADFGRQAIGWTGVGDFPKTADDPRIVDSDGDGHPGATVLVEAPLVGHGQVYVIQTGRTTVRGTWDGVAFVGTVDVPEFGQLVVGASSRMLANGPALVADPTRSSFRLERGRAGCG